MEPQFELIEVAGGVPIKAWSRGVPFEEKAVEQLKETARLPFIWKWVAAMADCHWGMGATIGSVLATKGAIVPAAVGVDIGCGMMAVKLNIKKDKLPTDLHALRLEIEKRVPNGRSDNGGRQDVGAWMVIPEDVKGIWERDFLDEYELLCKMEPDMRSRNSSRQLGTLGTGNHFIEVCLDPEENVWLLLHSGSRGLGNRIGTYFTQVAKAACKRKGIELPNAELAYLDEGTAEYNNYMKALALAQRFAWTNRLIMRKNIIEAMKEFVDVEEIDRVHCHHNYTQLEEHFGEQVWITRKGAVRARTGDMGIIPGSMGKKSFIVRGLGSEHSFHSCSHGSGRIMGRNVAKKTITLEDHAKATEGVECHKGIEVIDESPAAYKDPDAVMAAQKDLVEPVVALKQVLCVKGL